MCVDVEDPPSYAVKRLKPIRLMPQGYDPKELTNVLRPKIGFSGLCGCNLLKFLAQVVKVLRPKLLTSYKSKVKWVNRVPSEDRSEGL